MSPRGPRLPFVGDHQRRSQPADGVAERGDLLRHGLGTADDPDVVEQVLESRLGVRIACTRFYTTHVGAPIWPPHSPKARRASAKPRRASISREASMVR